jgi:hypothetical protein
LKKEEEVFFLLSPKKMKRNPQKRNLPKKFPSLQQAVE